MVHEVDPDPVEPIGNRRAAWATLRPVWSEHEVVDEQLGATVEELRQRPRALVGVEPVLLLHRHPRQLAPLAGDLVAEPRVLLLAGE